MGVWKWFKNQWNTFTKNPYRWLWSKIGGRPWTYIIRDVWHKAEFIWIVGLVSLGVYLGQHYEWRAILTGWLIFSVGYACGHFFWATEYIPGQRGNNDKEDGNA